MRLFAAVLAAALTALPSTAQIGNGSDITGPGITNGGIAGGTYQSGGFRNSDNAVFSTPNGTTIWTSGEVACAVTAAVPGVAQSLREGPLQPRPEVGGAPVDDEARRALWEVMRADSVDRGPASESLAAMLRGGAEPNSRVGRRARSLVDALSGLLGKAATCPPQERLIVAEPWEDAVFSYDRFLDARDAGQPNPAVVGVHSVLDTLMDAALAAAGGGTR
jgi:hypothetical protein